MDDVNVCDGLWTMDLYVMYYGWWMCMWWVMDVYVMEYGCVYDISCAVCWYICDFFVCADGKKKTKKIAFRLFAECHTRQRGLCRVPWPWHTAKLAECQSHGTRQRFFLKKEKISLPSARVWHSAKNFFKKAKRPLELTSNFFAEFWRDTRQRLYRVPDMWHSAKKPLPTALCRVRHSAKPLPSAIGALPSALNSTRQRARL